ncbi:Protein GlcG [Geodia barretti]|uniref:Protein GlcG n=1 Tax=Geodia barretti TaxID=519541 RepID=A0AA35XEL3_GEOBA|nr:Protein GlcG [Geodia barretti]
MEVDDMYNKPMLSLEQAQNAMRHVRLQLTARRKSTTDHPPRAHMAVVDDAGNLLAYARMDRCLRPTFAIRKAYTSAVRSMDTAAFAEQLSSSGRSLESFGDPQVIAIPGGVAVISDGAVVGAIGVGGLPSGLDDEAIARAGVAALGI